MREAGRHQDLGAPADRTLRASRGTSRAGLPYLGAVRGAALRPPAPRASDGARAIARRLALALASLVLALMAAELVYRRSTRPRESTPVPATGDQYRFYQHDPVLGWANAPGARGAFEREEFRYEISVNRYGMRQGAVERKPAPGVRRIAVLGDSFTWGIGVQDRERFTERLAALLLDVEVLNFGVSGYGPVQHLLALERVLDFDPELVVLAFCLGNDFLDNVQFVRYGYYKPYAELDEGGELRLLGGELPNTRAFGFERRPRWCGSELLGALVQVLTAEPAAALPEQRGLGALREQDMYAPELDEPRATQRELALAVNEAVLAELSRRLNAAGVRFLVVSAPTKFEYNRAGATGHEGRFDRLERALAASCERLGIEFLPAVHALHGDDFWSRDGHWNPRGHEKLAAALAAHIEERGLARRR